MANHFFKGVLFGSVAGAITGLLTAPRSGNDTRRKLTAELEEAAATTEDLNQSLARFQQSVKTTQSLTQETIPVVKEALEKDITAFKFQAEPRLKQIKEQLAVINSHLPASQETQTNIKKQP